MTKTLLITYFGPFPGVSVNPSGVTARQVADVLADESAVRVVTREVPVRRFRGDADRYSPGYGAQLGRGSRAG